MITGAMLVVASSGWIVFTAIDSVRTNGFSDAFSVVIRVLPSSWGLVAVDAAARHDWLLTVLPLVGLVVLVAVLLLAWSRVLGPPRLGRPAVRGSAGLTAREGRILGSATGMVYLKELRTWWRNPLRVQNLVVAPVFAILSCLVPLAFGSSVLLPFIGVLTALMGAATSANLYGQDGTALWMVLVAPGTEANDVRGRQMAWMTLFGPLSIVLALLGTVVSGHYELWPWAAAATVGVLGAGAGLVPLIGITQLAPGPDPHRSRYSPMDHGDATGGAFAMLVAAAVLTVPALVPVIIGTTLDNAEVKAAGVAVAVITGMVYWGVFSGVARRKLAARGPELLHLMRAGKELPGRVTEGASTLKAMPKAQQRLLWSSFGIGCIALFPQALVPMGMKLSGNIAKVWFLALYVPDAWQWPTIVLMFLLAAAAFGIAGRTFLTQQRRVRGTG
jgi:ABC-2 type transport system permease protein